MMRKRFDRERLKSVVAHVCAACSGVSAVRLHKILYLSDMLRYAQTGEPLTGATYRKQPGGPACDELRSVLSELHGIGAIEIHTVDYFGYLKKEYVTPFAPSLNRLANDEIELVNEVVEFVFGSGLAGTIGEFRHNRPWELAEYGDEIKYNSVFMMFPSEVSPEAMAWADAEVRRITI